MERNITTNFKSIMENNPAAAKYIAKALGTKPEGINTTYAPVVDLETGKVYAKLTDLAIDTNIPRQTLLYRFRRNDERFKYASCIGNKQLKKLCMAQAEKVEKAEAKALAAKGIKVIPVRFDPYNEYNSNHIETLIYNEPEKEAVLNDIFRTDNPKFWAKSTIIMDNGKISPVITHWERPNNNIHNDAKRASKYGDERTAIKKSCINHAPAITKTPQPYTGLEFAFMTQLPLEILEIIRDEMNEHGCKDWVAYNAYKEKHPTLYKGIIGRKSMTKKAVEERIMRKENETLKLHVADLEAEIARLKKGGVK